jgi:hypothetical protein
MITRMAQENFLWGAPRIHGELLMLGFKVSQATVSRYLSSLNRHPSQSWRTFIRNQALGFRYSDNLEHAKQDYGSPVDCSDRGKFTGPADQIVRRVADNRGAFHSRDIATRARWRTRSDRLRVFRCERAPGQPLIVGANPLSVSVQMRGPPRHAEILQSCALAIGEWCGPGFEKGHGICGFETCTAHQ